MPDNIISFEDAKKAANRTIEHLNSQQSEQKSMIEDIMKEINTLNPNLGGFEELSVMLTLPEDQFGLIAPVFLDELNKSFNNVSDKLLLAQGMNAAGIKLEDMQNQYTALTESIDKELSAISQQKRDFLKQMLGMTYNALADTEGIAKKVIQIPMELCNKDAKMPTYANVTDAGLDIYALEDITIAPGETKLIPTGLKVALPEGYELQVRPKSGRCLKTKLRVANTPGTIDAGYRDEIGVIIENVEPPIKDIRYEFVTGESDHEPDYYRIRSIEYGSSYTIGKGEKFAQLVLSEVPKAAFYQVESVGQIGDNRGGGFGSTGLK